MSLLNCRTIAILACLVSTPVAFGQRFSYGVIGGVSSVDPVPDYVHNESKRYVVGATAEYRAWRGLAVEFDFLYRRIGYSYTVSFADRPPELGGPTTLNYRSRTNVFEFPLLAKYYFRRSSNLQPFVLAGASFRKGNETAETTPTGNDIGRLPRYSSSSSWKSADLGGSFGGGVRWRAGRVSFSPQVRYTFWGGSPLPEASKHQADVLLGITF